MSNTRHARIARYLAVGAAALVPALTIAPSADASDASNCGAHVYYFTTPDGNGQYRVTATCSRNPGAYITLRAVCRNGESGKAVGVRYGRRIFASSSNLDASSVLCYQGTYPTDATVIYG